TAYYSSHVCASLFGGCNLRPVDFCATGQDGFQASLRRWEICRRDRGTGDPLPILVLACFETLSDRNHGCRGRVVRLRQRWAAGCFSRERRASQRSHTQRGHPSKERTSLLEPSLPPEERRHF